MTAAQLTPEAIAQIVQTVIAMVQPKRSVQVDALRAKLIKARDELNTVIALLGEPAPVAEKETPVEPVKPEPAADPIPVPPSLNPAPAEKKSGWSKVWSVTKKVLKVAAPVALAGATGGGSLAAYAPSIIDALSDPAVAGAAGATVAGVASAGVRIYGALKEKE